MSFLPGISSSSNVSGIGMVTQIYRAKSKKDLLFAEEIETEKEKVKEKAIKKGKQMVVVNAQHATVSSKRQVSLKDEIRQVKINFENRCFKKDKSKKKAERQARLKLEQYNWKKWLEKRNSKAVFRLSKREFKVFWGWYSSRREVNGSQHEELGGIRIDHAADDFMKIGLFENFADAIKFLKGVDADDSGFISFEEMMEALSDTSNESQVLCMRQFVATLTEKQESKKEAKKVAGNKVIRRSASTAAAESGTKFPGIVRNMASQKDDDVKLRRMHSV